MLLNVAKSSFPNAYARYVQWQYRRVPLATRIAPILASRAAPVDFDEHFERLQRSYTQWWPEYGYDDYSTWARGCERALKLLKTPALRRPELKVFEVGCGDGMTSYALAGFDSRRQVVLNDAEDWRDPRARAFPFVKGDACSRLPIASDSFDLVVTYNTFEHVENPETALDEMVRLCRAGGHIHIEFAPTYCSPLGLHAFSFMMPYPQFLFSPTLIEAKLKELGVDDLGEKSDSLQWTNQWRVARFRQLFRRADCEIVHLTEMSDNRHLGVVAEFPGAFCGRGLTVDDLVVGGFDVLLRKK